MTLMTQADLLRHAFVSVQTDAAFSEAVVVLRDGSRLYFCHRVDERWAKAIGPEGEKHVSGTAGAVLNGISLFRLNAKHLDIHFTDGSRWEHLFRHRATQ